MLPVRNDRPRPLTRRLRQALRPYVEVVVPAGATGAIYLLGAGHWQAFKQVLIGQGMPLPVVTVSAPVVAVLAILGMRYLLRQAFPRETSLDGE